jgi:hypothetical protein
VEVRLKRLVGFRSCFCLDELNAIPLPRTSNQDAFDKIIVLQIMDDEGFIGLLLL